MGGRTKWPARRPVSAALLCGLLISGCYRDTAVIRGTPTPQTRIIAELTLAGSEAMTEWIGAEATAVEGRVMSASADSLTLAMLRVYNGEDASVEWSEERVAFPRTALQDVRERRLDRARTSLLVGGIVAVATALAVSFVSADASGDSGDGAGPGTPPH